MTTIGFNSSEKDITDYLSERNNSSKHEKCIDDVVKRLLKGEFEFRGAKGRVILSNDGNAYKINENIGDYSFGKSVNLSSFYLQNVLAKLIYDNIPTEMKRFTVTPVDFFICEGGGISIFKTCNEGDLKNFINKCLENKDYDELDNSLMDCFLQISTILQYLEDHYGFIHNDLSINNLLVDRNENSLDFKLTDFDNSSINMNKYFKDMRVKTIFSGIIPTPTIKSYGKDIYKINPFVKRNVSGFFFRHTFDKKIYIDIYSLMISVIFYPPIIDIIDKLPQLNKLCDVIFLNEDLKKITKSMYTRTSPLQEIDDIVLFLIDNEISLRHNVKNIIIKYLSSTTF